MLRHFFSKPKLSRKEARWLETLGNFGIFPINLKPGRIHVLGDTLSRAPQTAFNAVEIPFIELDSVIGRYENDQFFGPIIQAMNRKEIEDLVKKKQVTNLMPLFERDGKRILY